MKTTSNYFKSFKNYLLLSTLIPASFLLPACGGGDDTPAAEKPAEITIVTPLSGLEIAPKAVNTPASGSATITVNTDSGAISGSVVLADFDSAINQVHIHVGAPVGGNSPPTVFFEVDPNNANKFNIPGGEVLSADNLNKLLVGDSYYQVHTVSIGGGEVRGQILPEAINVKRYSLTLGGQQVSPPVTTAGSGKAVLLVNTETGKLYGGISLSNITDDIGEPNATAAHIHDGVAGTNGGVIGSAKLSLDAIDKNLFSFDADSNLDADSLVKLANDGLYFQVHSTDVPKGEIRAQITSSLLQASLSSIQANIFTGTCASSTCHNATDKAANMSLDSIDNSYASLVGQDSTTYFIDVDTPYIRVKASDPDNSLLVKKLNGDSGFGAQMPLNKTPLSAYEIAMIRQWIADGANK